MALRTFRFNPSLGGFGRESSSSSQKSNFLGSGSIIEQGNLTEVGNDDNEHEEEVMEADAFAQIVKELVDNAMDACRSSCPQNKNDTQKSSSRPGVTKPTKKEKKGQGKKKGNAGKSLPELDPTTQRRVIVKIVPEDIAPSLQSKTSAREGKNEKTSQAALSSGPAPRELVRVVVTDNGCGMRDIQSCVDPFYTNKAHNSSRWSSNDSASAVGNDVEKKKGKNGHLAATCNRNNTAGRYGIGLTLCLLHAQRLVPHSRASIQSATAEDPNFTHVQCWVDTEGDAVRCWPATNEKDGKVMDPRRKTFARESGTSISLLLPGGSTAEAAWPRLASYFSKFQLSLDLPCSLEVLAPSLSHTPLYVQPVHEEGSTNIHETGCKDDDDSSHSAKETLCLFKNVMDEGEIPKASSSQQKASSPLVCDNEFRDWIDPMDLRVPSQRQQQGTEDDFGDWIDPMKLPIEKDNKFTSKTVHKVSQTTSASQSDSDSSCSISNKRKTQQQRKVSPQELVRSRLRRAAQKYLGKDVALENIACATVPIRQVISSINTTTPGQIQAVEEQPQLEIALIVHNQPQDESPDISNEDCDDGIVRKGAAATMSLIRLVNAVPLLDSAQAVACGLVQGLLDMQKIWNSFGLTVTPNPDRRWDSSCLPIYEVRDSDQVAPFFHTHHTHKLYEQENVDTTLVSEDEDEDNIQDEEESTEGEVSESVKVRSPRRRRRANTHQGRRGLLPANSRLGHILVICQLQANPTKLPLPTLCKGRLPLDDGPLMTAFQVATTRCLRQLQISNPTLFLTTKQLKTVERNIQFVPSLAVAVASIVTHSTSYHPVIDRYMTKSQEGRKVNGNETSSKDRLVDSMIQSLIGERLRRNIAQNTRQKADKKSKAKKKAKVDGDREDSVTVDQGRDIYEGEPGQETPRTQDGGFPRAKSHQQRHSLQRRMAKEKKGKENAHQHGSIQVSGC